MLQDVFVKSAEEPPRAHELLLTSLQNPRIRSVTARRLRRALKACPALSGGAGHRILVSARSGTAPQFPQPFGEAPICFNEPESMQIAGGEPTKIRRGRGPARSPWTHAIEA